MLKRLLIICPEFSKEYIIYQPWKQILEISKKIKSFGITIVIGTNASNASQIQGIDIISFSDKMLRELKGDSMRKILSFKPDMILWIGNPLSGYYLKKLKLDSIPIVLYISTMPFSKKELENFSISEFRTLGFSNIITTLSPFKKIIKYLNDDNISHIIVPNMTIKNGLLEKEVSEKKISVAPLCYEPENDVKSINIKKKLSSDFTLCYLGPVYSIRGVDFLLDVVELFKKRNIQIKLKFLLRTTQISKDENLLIKKCKSRNIENFLEIKSGILSRISLFNEIVSSDLVLIPTKFVWNEPPLAILEAMFLKKLVITSNVCGLPELMNDHGYSLPLESNVFFECIKNLIDNRDLLDDIALKGHNFVTSLPDWSFFANWILDTLNNIGSNSNDT